MASSARRAALQAEIVSELQPGERLVWTGHPDPRAVFRKLRWLFWIALPVVAGATLFAYDNVLAQFVLLAGLAMLLGPVVAAFRARGTIYALTGRRALVLSTSVGHRAFTSVDLSGADETVEVLRGEGDAGTVLFVSGLPPRRRYTDYTGKFGFWDVSNVSEVAAAVQSELDKWRR